MTQRLLTLVFCVAVFAGPPAMAAEKLLRRAGGELRASGFNYAEGVFQATDGSAAPVSRDGVVEWRLAPPAGAAQAAAPAPGGENGAVPAALEDYRRQGQELAALHPGVPGVVVVDDGEFVLTPDRRHLYRYHFVGLVLDESRTGWGQISWGFSEGRSRCRVELARCLTADGVLHELDQADVKVGRPASGGEHFDPNGRQISAEIPGVGVGAVVEYVAEYETYAPEDWRLFFPGFYFQGQEPMALSRLTVRVPAGEKLFWWTENWRAADPKPGFWGRCGNFFRRLNPFAAGPLRKTRLTVDGAAYDAHVWEKRRMPPLVTEPLMPPWHEVVPAVHATLMKDWRHLNQLTGGMQLERLRPTPEIESKTGEILAGSRDADEKIARIYHWVQKNIRYISVKSSLSSGWSGHPAAETMARGYGDCTDKAVLFSTMLKVAGIESEPVVLKTNDEGTFNPKYPVLSCNHCISEVRLPGRPPFFLDATSQDQRYPSLRIDNHGVLAINFIRGTRSLIPVPPGMVAHGKTAEEQMLVQADGSVVVESANTYSGGYEAGLRGGWKNAPEELRRPLMQQFLNGIAPGARLHALELPDPQDLAVPFGLEFSYILPEYLVGAKDVRILQVPDREMAFDETALETRRYPLVYTTSAGRRRRVAIGLPANLQLAELPPPVRIRGRHVSYSEKFTVQPDGGIIFESFFERRGRIVPPADYQAYRRDLQGITAATRRPIFLNTVGQ